MQPFLPVQMLGPRPPMAASGTQGCCTLPRCAGLLAGLIGLILCALDAFLMKGWVGAPMGTTVISGVPVYNYGGLPTLVATRREYTWALACKPGTTDAQASILCRSAGRCAGQGNPDQGGLPLVFVRGDEQVLQVLLQRYGQQIRYAEPDAAITPVPELGVETGLYPSPATVASWGLDRIDQRRGLDGRYAALVTGGGAGVNVYVTDTGIRTTHQDFQAGGTSRAIPTLEVFDDNLRECRGDPNCALDRNGHGTHCAGIVGGLSYGVAKGVTLHAVKVFPDNGEGFLSDWVLALNWIIINGIRPAVVSASLGGPRTRSFVQESVNRVTNAGITVVVAAGNGDNNACEYSPAFVPTAITVGASTINDQRAEFSNFGPCVDIFAPGVRITSAGIENNFVAARLSGTSMSCPHVSGAAALILQRNPAQSPAQVTGTLKAEATRGALADVGPGSPNLLLYVPPV